MKHYDNTRRLVGSYDYMATNKQGDEIIGTALAIRDHGLNTIFLSRCAFADPVEMYLLTALPTPWHLGEQGAELVLTARRDPGFSYETAAAALSARSKLGPPENLYIPGIWLESKQADKLRDWCEPFWKEPWND